MITEQTPYGLQVTIPQTGHNSEVVYRLRQVRKINNNCKYEQELIAEIEKKEKIWTDEFLKVAEEMESWLHKLVTPIDWLEYAQTYGDFYLNYHDRLNTLANKINECSFEYAERSRHGWCL